MYESPYTSTMICISTGERTLDPESMISEPRSQAGPISEGAYGTDGSESWVKGGAELKKGSRDVGRPPKLSAIIPAKGSYEYSYECRRRQTREQRHMRCDEASFGSESI